jgi:hypothetical protein
MTDRQPTQRRPWHRSIAIPLALFALLALLSLSMNSGAQGDGWLEREPLRREYQGGPVAHDARSQGAPVPGSHIQGMMPPYPDSQIPLTGFEWMLVLSLGAGAAWLVKHRELFVPVN